MLAFFTHLAFSVSFLYRNVADRRWHSYTGRCHGVLVHNGTGSGCALRLPVLQDPAETTGKEAIEKRDHALFLFFHTANGPELEALSHSRV